MLWGEKPYYSLDYYLKQTFGSKTYKASLDAGFTCPNRDGTIGRGGCIFCSRGGSGEFAGSRALSIKEQIDSQIEKLGSFHAKQYIAYYQAFTNTYADLEYSQRSETTSSPTQSGLVAISTTATYIRRGYDLTCFENALKRLNDAQIPVIVHVILGLPGEDKEKMLETIRYLNNAGIFGIKLPCPRVLSEVPVLPTPAFFWNIHKEAKQHPLPHSLVLSQYPLPQPFHVKKKTRGIYQGCFLKEQS